jgi:hypothetical protein
MMKTPQAQRAEGLKRLAHHGISGADAYLIDVIPIVDMMWADGKLQDVERRLLDQFLVEHVENLNRLAGTAVLSIERARTFVGRFLATRPDSALVRELIELIPPTRFSSTAATLHGIQRQRILDWCLDIAASSVADYPYGDHDRFNSAEKAAYDRILHALYRDQSLA